MNGDQWTLDAGDGYQPPRLSYAAHPIIAPEPTRRESPVGLSDGDRLVIGILAIICLPTLVPLLCFGAIALIGWLS